MTYDVQAKRTEKFKKLLRKYLEHIQFSVFSGDLPESKLIELRRAVGRLLEPGEIVTEVTAANRKNVKVAIIRKTKAAKARPDAQKTGLIRRISGSCDFGDHIPAKKIWLYFRNSRGGATSPE